MKILIIGSGGREHALAWKIKQAKNISQIFIAPGNGGTAQIGQNINIAANNLNSLLKFAKTNKVDLTIVGPEMPLALGIVDLFEKNNLLAFGPTKKAAQIESSKVFAKNFMKKFKIPTADFKVFSHYQQAKKYLKTCQFPQVLKADGLAAGKGVIVCQNKNEALGALKKIMVDKKFGSAGNKVIIENCLFGQEVSVVCFSDGQTVLPMLDCQDHKAVFNNDKGPNTGGMGAYAPADLINKKLMLKITKDILKPTILGMKKIGIPYKGILYAGLMLTSNGPKVLEFNCRFGDPETQPQLMLLKSNLIDLMQACVKGTLKKKKLSWYSGYAVCVVLASKGYPEKYEKGFKIKGLPKKGSPYLQIFQASTKKEGKKIITNGGRVLGITSRALTLKKAIKKAYLAAKKIKFKNKYYRTDIAAKAIQPPRLDNQGTSGKKLINQVNQIEVSFKIPDNRVLDLKKNLKSFNFKNKVKNILLADIYTINKKINPINLKKIAFSLINPITQKVNINQLWFPDNFSWVIEIGLLPGVTDNVANTVKENIKNLLKKKFADNEGVYTSQLIFIQGKLNKKEVLSLASSLINPLIQRINIKKAAQFKKNKGMDIFLPQVKLKEKTRVFKINLNVSDKKLKSLGKSGIIEPNGKKRGSLALSLVYMKAIQKYFQKLGRNPTDIELESIAQTWSEHCKHTIFNNPIGNIKNGLFKTFISGATNKIREKKGKKDICVSVFTDNSGAITFDKNWLITAKVETHNSPSALDPFGGAITGIVGVNRDTIGFGLGAKPIANYYGFCLANPNNKLSLYQDKRLNKKMLSSKRIMEGVIKGVNVGGNCSGIPTPQGFLFFDLSFKAKPLVFVGTIGLIPRKKGKRLLYQKKAQKGDYIVMVGGRVGLDGIHGATFSSQALDSNSPATAVQIGDPITQKKLSDALVKEARDLELYNSITDNGAGGLSSSVGEMAKESGGCIVNLEKVPLKYPGLAPWQIWLSESQERMTLAVPAKKWQKFFNLMKKRGVEATIIGRFSDSGRCLVKYQGKTIMDIKMDFLHNGLPAVKQKISWQKKSYPEAKIPLLKNLTKTLIFLLKRPNIASFQFVSQQYDHEVQGGSVIKPLQGRGRVNGQATVIRPVLSSSKGIVISQGLNPYYSQISCYYMAASCIDTAIRNVVAAGANPEKIVLLDNFCWCSSNQPTKLNQLKQAAKACYDYALAFETPFISGKDSMFNDFNGFNAKGKKIKMSILPTLLISSLGIIDNIKKAVSIDVKLPGDLIYILGETLEELGGSEYFIANNCIGNKIAKVNALKNKKLYQALAKSIKKGLIASSISLTRGGLAIALAKMAMAGSWGVNISLKNLPGDWQRDDYALFSESQGRILVTINPQKQAMFEKIIKGNVFALIGKVTKRKAIIISNKNNKTIVNLNLGLALKAYKKTFKDY